MDKIIEGRVLKLGDDIDTDSILPGRYLTLSKPEDLGKHVMEGYDLHYKDKIQEGDVIVAGSNFGCGSSREHAPIALKASGIKSKNDTKLITPLANAKEDIIILSFFLLLKKIKTLPIKVESPAIKDKINPNFIFIRNPLSYF